jgi:hypothetical protein
MPRVKRGLEPPKSHFPDLVMKLAEEMKNSRESGQPMIEEHYFPRANTVRVTVIWDQWAPVTDEERAATIWQAYEQVEGKEFRDRIVLAIGVTVPEAYESGLLPYQVLPAVRKGDPVTLEQCRQAMLDQGASVLFDPNQPQLRFATEEEAQAAVKRLGKQLPGSEPLWIICKEVAPTTTTTTPTPYGSW